MEFTALSRDYEAETKLSTCQRKNCWDHPLLNDTERRIGDVDGVDQNFDDEDEDNNNEKKDISPKKDKAPERKGMTLIDPLANPLADPLGGGGNPLMGGDFDPLGAMGGGVGGAPAAPSSLSTPQSTKSTSKSNSDTPSGTSGRGSTATDSSSSNSNAFQLRWTDFKNDVLLNYNVSGKFRVKANFMTDVEDGLEQKQNKLL